MGEKKQIYPLMLRLNNNISDGFARGQDNNTIIENDDTVELQIIVKGSNYRKEEVYESVKTICQKALEYYC